VVGSFKNIVPVSATATQLKSWLNAGLAFLYPEACQLCGENRAKRTDGLVCSRCWQNVRFIRPPFCERCGLPYQGDITTPFECSNCRDLELHFTSARSAVVAGGIVRDVIHRYKYQREVWFEPFLADLLMREALSPLREERWDCIVPVPLYPVKQREREFNQAARLAGHLSRAAKIPLNEKWLRRVIPTNTQTRLTREQRAANMRGAFLWNGAGNLHGERVVVVDDVFTTGATTDACARALLDAGASEVCVWTVARGL
jgi:competence protein ComFC